MAKVVLREYNNRRGSRDGRREATPGNRSEGGRRGSTLVDIDHYLVKTARIQIGIRRDEDRIREDPKPDAVTEVILQRLRNHDLLREDRRGTALTTIITDPHIVRLLSGGSLSLRRPFDRAEARRGAELAVRTLYHGYMGRGPLPDDVVLSHIIHAQTNIPETLWATERHFQGKTATYYHVACYLYCLVIRTYHLSNTVVDAGVTQDQPRALRQAEAMIAQLEAQIAQQLGIVG